MRDTQKSLFDKEIRVLLADTAAWFNPKPEHVRGYWIAVKQYDLEVVQTAFEAIRSRFTGHFTPADVRNAANEAVKAITRQADEKPVPGEPVDPRGQEFDDCKHDAIVGYCFKSCGEIPGGQQVGRYVGGFDWSPIVLASTVPASSRLNDHEKAWGKFFELLRYEWDQWAKTKQAA